MAMWVARARRTGRWLSRTDLDRLVAAVEAAAPGGILKITHLPAGATDGEIDTLQCRTEADSVSDLINALNDPPSILGVRVEMTRPGELDAAITVDIGVPNGDWVPWGVHRRTVIRVTGPDEQWVRRQCTALVGLLRPTEFWGRGRRKLLDLISATTFAVALYTWAGSFVLDTTDDDRSNTWFSIAVALSVYFAILYKIDKYLSRSIVLLKPRRLEKALLKLNRYHRQHLSHGALPTFDVTTIIAALSLIVAVGAWLLPR
ncbi:hypothetical protein ABZY10_31530 [Streptomyces sp. NPDC006539]|uniref:hypothetical protein n=1 Tax=Streptomyces TaxID=1883 RepID=UPI0033914E7C